MRHSYRRRKRRVNRGMLVLLLLLVAVFLVSCMAGSDPLWIRSVFGVDVVHYDTEPTLQVCEPDGEQAEQLCQMIGDLTSANSLSLRTFRKPSQAVNAYRDALLNNLLRDHYVLYTGNVISTSSTAYSMRAITTLIPKKDFADEAFRYFGVSSPRHKDGELFDYVSREGGYTAPVQAWTSRVQVLADGLEETEHTFRLTFRLSDGDAISEQYRAVFVKREDGSCFIYTLDRM